MAHHSLGVSILAYADGEVFSGAEVVFVDILRDLAASDRFQVTCAAASGNVRLKTELEGIEGVEVVAAPDHPGAFAALRRTTADLPPARAILVNLPSAEHGAPALREAHRRGVPCVGIFHIHHSLASAGFRLGGMRDWVCRPALRKGLTDAFVVAPSAAPDAARTWRLDPQRVHPIPLRPAVLADLPARAAARAALGVPVRQRVVALPGRVSAKQKGHDLFVAVAARLSDIEDVHWLVAGDGPDLESIRGAAATAGVGDRMTFSGAQPIERVLAAADAVLLPSRFEGLPLVALECLAAGVPGVASAVDGLGVVWPSEWTVEPDAEALADCLTAFLAADPDVIERRFAAAAADALLRHTGAPGPVVAHRLEALVGHG